MSRLEELVRSVLLAIFMQLSGSCVKKMQ